MKRLLRIILLFVCLSVSSVLAADAKGVPPAQNFDYSIVEQGEHFNVLRRLESVVAPDGSGKSLRTNSVVQLETGLNYLDPFGFWRVSDATFRLEGGEAIGDQTPHKVRLPGVMGPQSHVQIALPDGQVAESRVFGLAYYEPQSGRSVLLAELKESNGVLEEPNRIVYPGAFTDFAADLVFTHRRSGLEQDVVLREAPPGPEQFGLDPQQTRLEVWTEFLTAPEPELRTQVLNGAEVEAHGSAPLVDQTIDFGSMRMDRGTVFPADGLREALGFVAKEWLRVNDGRRFLVETVEVNAVARGLKELPASQGGASLRRRTVRGRAFAGITGSPKANLLRRGGIQLAGKPNNNRQRPGLVLDYTMSTSATNFTFVSGRTYYVTGPVILSGSGTTFEAGVVIKYANTNSAKITVNTPVSWQALPYRPVVLTASDDATVGERVTTNILSGYYANTALEINTTSGFEMPNLRITHAKTAVTLLSTGSVVIRHAQFVNCETGLRLQAGVTTTIRNGLFHNVLTTISTTTNAVAIGEHVTVNTATWLNPNSSLKLILTNSILAGVANSNPYTNVNVSVVSNPSSVFHVVGAGANYLQAGNSNRDAGVTTIEPQLAAELKLMTTTAPVVDTNTYSTDVVMSAVVARDTNTPDRGYHYWPLDYAVNSMTVTNNALVTLTNGVAVAVFGNTGLGLRVVGSASVCAQGSPTKMVRFTRFTTVQEQPIFWGGRPPGGVVTLSTGTAGALGVRFADFSYLPNQDYPFWTDGSSLTKAGSFLARDCNFFQSNFQFWGPSTNPPSRVAFINNLFEGGEDVWWSGTLQLEIRNNTFNRTTLNWQPAVTNWVVQDNLFDRSDIFELTPVFHTHNAFYNCTGYFAVTNLTDIVLSSLAYQAATNGTFFGRFYLASSNPTLVDRGSRSADQSRLSYHTTQPNQTREATSVVDIGFHYVAVTGAGVPLDLDADSIPDYQENQSGQCPCEYQTCQNTPPSVALISPRHGALFATTPTNIILSAIVADPDDGVDKVQFFTNNVLAGTIYSAPYQLTLGSVGSGIINISARAIDNSGATSTTPTITITNNSIPTLAWLAPSGTSPTTNTTVAPGAISLAVTATDNDGNITNVKFFSGLTNSTPFATLTSPNLGTNGYSNRWVNVPAGRYPIYVTATDNRGAIRLSETRLFVVNPSNPVPQVSITSPTNGAVLKAYSSPTLVATATDPGGAVARVDFYSGERLLGSDTAGVANLFQATVRGLKPGTYRLTAKAADNGSPTGRMTSQPVMITVAEPEPVASGGFWDPAFGNFAGFGPDCEITGSAVAVDAAGDLYFGGFGCATGGAFRVMKHSTCTWSAPLIRNVGEGGDAQGAAEGINTLLAYGSDLYLGGAFNLAEEAWSHYICKRSGNTVVEIGDGLGFSGSTCSAPTKQGVHALCQLNGDLYIGGDFTSAGGNSSIQYLAKLVGTSTSWSAVAGGIVNGRVRAIVEFENTLYVGGDFTSAGGGSNTQFLAKLVDGQWEAVGGGVNGPVLALTSHNGRLFVGGEFTTVGGLSGANCVAVWDGLRWNTINGGVSDGTQDIPDYGCSPTNRVAAIAARGNTIYVTGDFTKAWNGNTSVAANYVARADWSEEDQNWQWSALMEGLRFDNTVISGGTDAYEHLAAGRGITLRELANNTGYEVVVTGTFTQAGGVRARNVARWVVGQSDCPITGPSVQITAPGAGSRILSNSTTFIATASGPNTVTNVYFYLDGALAGQGTLSSGWQLAVSNLTLGSHMLKAVAADSTGKNAASAPVGFVVAQPSGPSVTNETFVVFSSGNATNLNVLANDAGTGPLRIVSVNQWANPLGSSAAGAVSIGYLGKHLEFQPRPHTFGVSAISYGVADNTGTNTGMATVFVKSLPRVFLKSPIDGTNYTSAPNVLVEGEARDYDGSISNVTLYVNGLQYGSPTTATNFSINWSTSSAGFYSLVVLARDNEGYTNASAPVLVRYDPPGGNNLVADITNLSNAATTNTTLVSISYPVIRDGFFDLQGQVYDSDLTNQRDTNVVSYAVLIYGPSDTQTPVANLTPGTLNWQGFRPGGDSSGGLGKLNLTALPNGVYDLKLVVRSQGQEVSDQVRISLDKGSGGTGGDFKLGAFSFTEQDLVIPVNGIPLTVVRKYDSLNLVEADFGWCWTMSINDVDATLDEERSPTEVLAFNGMDGNDGAYTEFSLRTGGGRNVMLTLPDGRRANFLFKPRFSTNPEKPVAWAEWQSPAGVTATLTFAGVPIGADDLIQANTINFQANGWGNAVWSNGEPRTPYEAYDIPGYDLWFLDGTVFELRRTPAFGNGEYVSYYPEDSASPVPVKAYLPPVKLTAIQQKSGDRIEVSDQGITHRRAGDYSPTRSVWFERDEKRRLIAIRDPLGQSGSNPSGPELVRYLYNDDSGNLVQVRRLVDRAGAGTYVTNRYHYDHPRFPHYITSIENGRGVPITRNEYDDLGRLVAVIDPAGKTNRFVHDIVNREETIYDRTGVPAKYVYDSRGNVLRHIDAYGKTNVFTYNSTGELLTATDPLGNVTSRTYDTNGNLLTVTSPYPAGADPLKFRTTFTYDSGGRLRTTTLPTGGVLETVYHGTNALPIAERAGITTIWSALYNDNAQMYSESDVFGTTTYGNFTGAGEPRLLDSPVGSDITSTYNANGQISGQVSVSLSGANVTSTIDYDALGREESATYLSGSTKMPSLAYGYEADLDWGVADGSTFGHLERSVDDQGRIAGWKTAAGAAPGFAYDDNGRLRFETNSLNLVTAYGYDLVGRITAVTNLATTAFIGYGYDDAGRKIAQTNALNQRELFAYWPDGSLKTMTNAADKTWNYTNEVGGSCCGGSGGGAATVADPMGRQVIETRSPYGLLTQVQRKSGGLTRTRTISYPPNVVSVDQEGEDYPYDLTDEGGRVRSLRYDSFGRQTTATDLGGNTYTSQYDATSGVWKRVLGPTVAIQNQGNIQETLVEYTTFDSWDREKTVTYAGLATPRSLYYENEKTTPTAGAAHLPYKITFPSGDRVEFDYETASPTGRVRERRYYKGSNLEERVQFTYRADDSIALLEDKTTATTLTNYFLYDTAGRPNGIIFPPQTLNGARLDYEFDLLNRISKVKIKSNNTGGAKQYVIGYEYDVVGNLQYVKVYDPNSPSTVLHTTTFTYDDIGRMLTRSNSGSGPVTRYFYKIPQTGVVPDSWTTYAPDDGVRHIEHGRGGTLVTRITYERADGGEPSRIWFNDLTTGNWNAGETVTLSYPYGFRLGTEDWSSTSDVVYTYDAIGNRRTRAESGTTLTTSYNTGFRINQVTGGSSTENYGYDNGGYGTSISRGGTSWAMTWTAAGRLKTATKAGVTTTYAYDPTGRRTEAVRSGQTRRFIVGPTADTDLEVIHAVTDGTTGLGGIKALYVHAGDQPILRFTVNPGNGALEGPVYYLEDANGSVIAQATGATGAITRFRYDGFGIPRIPSTYTDPAATTSFPSGAGGDFRFHGAWLEADTGFYHMRARDYDPVTGRFLSRDPVEGATTEPESYHPYVFAYSNPHFYSDPTGEFTVMEIGIVNSGQFADKSARSTAAQYARKKVKDTIGQLVKDEVTKQIRNLLPVDDILASFQDGIHFGNLLRRTICNTLHAPDQMFFEVPITSDGRPLGNGFSCNETIDSDEVLRLARLQVPRPDFVIGSRPPHSAGSFPKTWLIGEIKASTSTLYGDYIRPGRKSEQFWAVLNYAGKHTHSRTALFVTGVKGNNPPSDAIVISEIGKSALSKGVVPVVIRIAD